MTIREIAAAAKTAWFTHVRRVPQAWTIDHPVVSLTFDDVPLSAFSVGLPILDRYNVKATFYTCTGIDGTEKRHLGAAEISSLAEQGHEIGCHTSTHYSVGKLGQAGLDDDCRINRAALQAVTNGKWPRNFAFPHGEMAIGIKHRMMQSFGSLRSTRMGVNHGIFDLACLKAVPVYHGNFDLAFASRWLDSAVSCRGWLIFYTHGISAPESAPQSAFDLRADQLETLIELIRERDLPVHTIESVLACLRSSNSN